MAEPEGQGTGATIDNGMKKPVILLFLWCYVLAGYAQDPAYQLREFHLPAGFDNQIITCAERDQAGLLWFATNSGLYRYDGQAVIHLSEAETGGNPAITMLYADRSDNLWVGTRDGLSRLHLSQWKRIPIKSPDSEAVLDITAICQGGNKIYAATKNGQLYVIENDSLRLVMDVRQLFPKRYSQPYITCIQAPYPGTLWMGTSFGKVIRIQTGDPQDPHPSCYGQAAFDGEYGYAYFHRSGIGLVMVADHGLYLFDTHSGDFEKIPGLPGELGKSGAGFMEFLNQDEVVIMTNAPSIGKDKLFIYNFKTGQFTLQKLNYPSFLAKNHLVWVHKTGSTVLLSLNAHIMKLTPANALFKTFLTDAKALSSIRSVYKQPGGKLFAGSYRDGFLRLDERTGAATVIARKYVYSMLSWNKDSLLLGTEGDGLMWYETKTNRLRPLHLSPEIQGDVPLGRFITVLLRLKTGAVLTGTEEGLYMVYPYARTARAISKTATTRYKVFSLLQTGKNVLVGTTHGIQSWNSQTDALRPFVLDSSMNKTPSTIYAMALVNGQIWAATGGRGICILDQQGHLLHRLTNAGGLAGDIVFSLVTTDDFVFAGTRTGLSVINKHSKQIRNYSDMDQLPVNEFNSAATFRANDTLYMGTINGIVRIDTKRLDPSEKEGVDIPIRVTDLTVAQKSDKIRHNYALAYQRAHPLNISPDVRYFSVGFGGLEGSEQDLRYYYRLRESGPWDPIGPTQQITFVGMSPGRYNLQLAAQLPDNQWTKPLLSVPLIVEPAYYQTLWFKLLVVLAVAAVVWGFFKYREKQGEKERLLRLQIAGDLHDEVGSTLAGISMQADMLLSGRQAHLNDYLRNIATSGRSAVHTMSDIVWSIDPRNDDTLSLVKRLERYGRKAMAPAEIAISFDVQANNEPLYISQEKRQNIMLIFKEALTNIAKHAAATAVNISYRVDRKGLRLIIADNGRGLPELADLNQGHGMRNMRMRAETIGAKLYFPAVAAGVTIVLECRI